MDKVRAREEGPLHASVQHERISKLRRTDHLSRNGRTGREASQTVMETEVKKTLLAAAAIAVVFAGPAFAQLSGNLDRAPYAGAASDAIHGDRTIYRHPVRR